mmetsp:Transcript_15196/g.51503  ORF Transcript_15196/g.51503 Transcript_15196/m.51503 type:complete len:200 (+) Transcript_15196:261-860(+)
MAPPSILWNSCVVASHSSVRPKNTTSSSSRRLASWTMALVTSTSLAHQNPKSIFVWQDFMAGKNAYSTRGCGEASTMSRHLLLSLVPLYLRPWGVMTPKLNALTMRLMGSLSMVTVTPESSGRRRGWWWPMRKPSWENLTSHHCGEGYMAKSSRSLGQWFRVAASLGQPHMYSMRTMGVPHFWMCSHLMRLGSPVASHR